MKNTKAWIPVLSLLTVAGCVGSQNQTTIEEIEGAAGLAFVEAYIEYGGPRSEWAGPMSFVVHVVARDDDRAYLTTTPDLFKRSGAETLRRRLASAEHDRAHAAARYAGTNPPSEGGEDVPPPPVDETTPPEMADTQVDEMRDAATLSTVFVRDHLNELAIQMKAADVTFRGCLTPVRVRLVRADGSILEKAGCRSARGWPRFASETVSRLWSAAVYGEPKRRVASSH